MKNFIGIIFISILLFNSQIYAEHWGKPKINGNGPWNQNLIISVTDSKNNILLNNGDILVKQAGVANLIIIKNKPRLYFQWLPTSKDLYKNFDHIAFVDFENGWSDPRIISIPFKDKPHKYPVDPTVVKLEDGSFRLYFTTVKKGRAHISSAKSKDGINFSLEKGKRFGDKKLNLKDSAVVFYNGLWHIITPSHKQNGQGYYGVSTDGIVFERKEDVKINVKGDWLGNFSIVDGRVFFYGTGFIASSKDFNNWQLESKHNVADPAIVFFDNKKILVSTSIN